MAGTSLEHRSGPGEPDDGHGAVARVQQGAVVSYNPDAPSEDWGWHGSRVVGDLSCPAKRRNPVLSARHRTSRRHLHGSHLDDMAGPDEANHRGRGYRHSGRGRNLFIHVRADQGVGVRASGDELLSGLRQPLLTTSFLWLAMSPFGRFCCKSQS